MGLDSRKCFYWFSITNKLVVEEAQDVEFSISTSDRDIHVPIIARQAI